MRRGVRGVLNVIVHTCISIAVDDQADGASNFAENRKFPRHVPGVAENLFDSVKKLGVDGAGEELRTDEEVLQDTGSCVGGNGVGHLAVGEQEMARKRILWGE